MWRKLHSFFSRCTDRTVGIGLDSAPVLTGPKAVRWRTGRIVLAVAVLGAIVCGSVYGFNEAEYRAAKRQLDEARGRSELLRPMREKMLMAEAKTAIIDRKETVLTALTKDRLSFYAVLTGLTVKAPPQLRLTDLEADGGLLKIGGTAPDSSDLTLFIERLEQDVILAGPVLVKAEQAGTPSAGRFQVAAKVRER
ncbi:MAG: PilN domain-containing protein [Negativicutes bacterium]|nr:PilN domain-containing protein [Negativicutes bacterium]